MTDETDHSEADSGRSEQEKREATVKTTSGPANDPDVFLVEYPDGTVDYEPGTPRNQALFGEGLYSEIDGHNEFFPEGESFIALDADVANDDYRITADGATVRVPDEFVDDVIKAFDSSYPARRMRTVYEDIVEGQVRRNVVESFDERFPDDRVVKTEDGWEVDDTFLVTYEGDNHLIGVDPRSPHGDEYDESKQAVYLDLDADEEREVTAPNSETYSLTELEQIFLTTIEGLLYPEDYFDVELVDEIEQHKTDDDRLGDVVEDLADGADVTGFTDPLSGIHHGSKNHSFSKHDVRDLNVTEQVREMLWSNPFDHLSVHELLLRKQEFVENPDVEIFADSHDDDSEFKWNEIEKTSENAPIPPESREKLNSMFE